MGRPKRASDEESHRLGRILAQAEEHASRRWQGEFAWSEAEPPGARPQPQPPAQASPSLQLELPWRAPAQ